MNGQLLQSQFVGGKLRHRNIEIYRILLLFYNVKASSEKWQGWGSNSSYGPELPGLAITLSQSQALQNRSASVQIPVLPFTKHFKFLRLYFICQMYNDNILHHKIFL